MQRRRFLQVTAGATALGTLAGCTQNTDDENSDEQTANTTTRTPGETGTDSTTTAGRNTDTLSESPPGGSTTSPGEPGASDPTPAPTTMTGTKNGVDYTFTVVSNSCGTSENTADVEFNEDAGTVVVTGTTNGRNTCMTAKLGTINYDESSDTLSVDIVTVQKDDGSNDDDSMTVCGQCIVEIEYKATVSFEETIPSEVGVSHDGNGVVGAEYGSASSAPQTTSQ